MDKKERAPPLEAQQIENTLQFHLRPEIIQDPNGQASLAALLEIPRIRSELSSHPRIAESVSSALGAVEHEGLAILAGVLTMYVAESSNDRAKEIWEEVVQNHASHIANEAVIDMAARIANFDVESPTELMRAAAWIEHFETIRTPYM